MDHIAKKMAALRKRLDKIQDDIDALQRSCPHSDVRFKFWSNAGNYDPHDDIYGVDVECLACGSRRTFCSDNPNYRQPYRADSLHPGVMLGFKGTWVDW